MSDVEMGDEAGNGRGSARLSRPNILLLVLDSVRAENVTCYGYSRPTTPVLDQIAREGTLYEQAISVGCWTLPVHASVFTGLYPSSHGLTVSRSALREGYPTLARRLGAAGYETACFSNNPYISAATGLTQGFDRVDDLWERSRPQGIAKPRGSVLLASLERGGPAARPALIAARRMIRLRSAVRRARRWRSRRDRGARLTNERIRAWLNERDEPAPFFAFVNYMESHEPYEPPYPHNGRFTASGRFPWRAARPSKREILASPEPTRSAALEAIRARYDGTVSYLDERVGELLRYLDDLDVLDDTVVVVTSDHGDSIGEHGHLGHRVFLHEQLVRVPLIIRHPARFGAGVRVRRQVQLGDLFPTVLELAGADDRPPVPPAFPSLFAPVGGERRSTFAENTAPKAYQAVRSRMIREDRFKLISSSNGVDELYDLVEDPGELQNLVGERRDVVERLRAELAGWERSLDRLDIETEAEYDEEVLERLRGLGYLE